MLVNFTKMQCLGNDLIVTDDANDISPERVRKLCDRHFGVGGDGVLAVTKADRTTIHANYWLTDGSRQEVSPNAIMCAVRFAVEFRMTRPGDIFIEATAGFFKGNWDGADPINIQAQVGKVEDHHRAEALHGYEFNVASLGGLHAIAIVPDIAAVDLDLVGSSVENNPAFEDQVSVVFAQIKDDHIEMVEWERGVGRTHACGTGMVTSSVVAENLGEIAFPAVVNSPGGKAKIWVDEDGYACMQAPAHLVYDASVDV